MLRRFLLLMTALLLAGTGCQEEGSNAAFDPAAELTASDGDRRADGDFCFFDASFWRHQFDVALDQASGNQQINDDTLEDLLAVVADHGAIDFEDGDSEISFEEADAILDSTIDTPCDWAARQYFVLLLNFAFNDADGTVRVDIDGTGGPDIDLADALDEIEEDLLAGRCVEANAVAERINAAGCDDDDDDGELCFRGLGFWKHQFSDGNRGRHIDDDTLEALLLVVAGLTDFDFGQDGDGVISFDEAADNLEGRGPRSQCEKAMQHYFVLLLNFAHSGADGTVRVDTDGRNGPDTALTDVLDEIEEDIQEGDCEEAKELAEHLNEMDCDGDDDHDDDDDDDDDDEHDDCDHDDDEDEGDD